MINCRVWQNKREKKSWDACKGMVIPGGNGKASSLTTWEQVTKKTLLIPSGKNYDK